MRDEAHDSLALACFVRPARLRRRLQRSQCGQVLVRLVDALTTPSSPELSPDAHGSAHEKESSAPGGRVLPATHWLFAVRLARGLACIDNARSRVRCCVRGMLNRERHVGDYS
jgi:hypothetical protein